MLLQALCSISYSLVNSNWSYSPETPNLGQIWRFLAPCDLEIWWMTLKNNRAPLLSNIKLHVSFHHHMWIQTGVTVRKRLSWVVTSVTLTFDLWPWPFVWTLAWSLVITPENFMMIQCKPDISRSCISRNWIYHGCMLDPIFWRPRARYFSRNRGNTLDPIRRRQFFTKSAHRNSLCSRFAGDNFPRNQR